MAAAAPAPSAPLTNNSLADGEDSNMSSPLSEVDDKDGDPYDPDIMALDRPEPRDVASDSESNLSEANDTEAETERLYDTPQVVRHKNLVMNQIDEEEVDTPDDTPTKQSSIIVAKSTIRDVDDSLSDVDMSAPPSSPPEAPASPVKTTRSVSSEDKKLPSEAKKRKRSPTPDETMEPEEPVRKRTASVDVSEQVAADKEEATIEVGPKSDDARPVRSPIVRTAAADDRDDKVASLRRDDSPPREPVISKKITRNGSKQAKAAITNGADNEEHDAPTEDDTEARPDDEGMEADAEEDAEAANKHDEEEAERKRIAAEEWTEIEAKFSIFRDRLYKERLEKLEREEQALTADVPYHPEYLNMKQCLDEMHEEKLRKINKEHEYVLAAHDRVAIARRSTIWGQFYQGIREKREEMLSKLNRQWHDTQNSRRNAHSVSEYALLFPPTPAQRTRNAVAYNTEVSTLSGLARHVGFPSAPSMRGVTASEAEEDLEAIRRARRHRHQTTVQQHAGYPSGLDSAGEQFIKNTPWANPNHPQHHPSTATAAPSSEAQGGLPAQPARINGQASAQRLGTDRPQNRNSSASPEVARSASRGQPKRAGGGLPGSSSVSNKPSTTAKQDAIAIPISS